MSEVIRKCCKCKKIAPHTVGAGYCKKCRNKMKKERYHTDPIFRAAEIKASSPRSKKMYQIKKAWKDDYLSKHRCIDCGNTDIRVLEFHHRDPRKKDFTISVCVNIEKVKIEVKKCDVLCSNCHNIKHYYDGGRYSSN